MSDIAILDSPLREIDVLTFQEQIVGYTVEHLRLGSGAIQSSVESEFNLSPYRALYLRVGDITESILDSAPNLEIISTCGSGYDHIDIDAATNRGIIVTHTPEASSPGVIEHTFGLIFTFVHRFPEMFEVTENGNWEDGQTTVGELRGRTLGVVGLGTNGARVATIAKNTFGADVIAYDPYVSGELVSTIYPRVTKKEILGKGILLVDKNTVFETADILTLHVPLTDLTRHMVSESELKALEGDYLINTSRGEVVHEEALIRAVDQLAGVGLDVMQSEPPDPSNSLLSAPNVLITPHIAGGTEGYIKRSALINAKRIQKALKGENPGGVVNPEVLE